ncbi:putative leucine-rich repeat-containing protein DDB_G0290503 isoform X2 [Ptychodera flava]
MNIENEELKIQALKEQEECQRLISEYHARQESINALTQQLCVSDEINKEKDEEILQLSRKLSESLRKHMELDDEYGVLHNILKETEEVVKSQQEQLNYCHKALQRSHSEISKLNTTKSQLLKQCEEYQDKDQDMQCALKALNENISELANERRHLCNEITNLNDHVREKKLKIAEIKKDLKRQKKLIKKVSGVANQQPQSGDEECQPSLDYIFDDMDELDFHHAAPVSSSPRRGKKRAVCIQEDEDVSDEEMLSCRYPERLSPSPIFVGSSTWKLKSIWNTGQSGTEVKPQSGSHSKYVQTTDDKYQEFECNQKNQRKYQHNASEFTTLTSKAVSENKPGAKTGNKIMKLKNQVPESRLLSYKQGTGKENVRPDQDTEENYKDSMHQNSSEDVLPGVRRRSRARRLTYMNSQIIPDLHQGASEVQTDDHTQSHWHGLDCPGIENNRFSKFCHHFQEERKDMQQDSVNDRASELSYDRKELPVLDDVSDEINRRGSSSSSSIPVTDEESIRYSSSNSDDNQTSGSEKTEGDYTEKHRTDSKQRPHPSEIDAEGVLLRKHEMESYIIRSKNRAWQSVYIVQEGKILKFYEDQYSKNMGLISEDKPPLELTHAQVTMATDYTKKKHVFRIRLTTGAQYLFQARDVPEMMFWLCSLDAVTHGPNETTAPYGANYPLHIMENSVDSSRKPTVWKKLLQNAYSPLKKH